MIRYPAYKTRIKQILRFMEYLYPYRDKQALLYICSFFSIAVGLLNTYLTRAVIDFAFMARDLYVFNMLVVAGVILYLFSIPIECIRKNVLFYIKTNVSFALRSRFYRQMHTLSLRFSQSRTVGEQLYRLGPDIDGVVSLIIDTIPNLVIFIFRFLLLLSICLWLSVNLTLLIIAISPLVYIHTRFFTKRQYVLGKEITERSQGVSAALQEAVANIRLIKIFAKEGSEHRRYLRDIISQIRLSIKNLKIGLFKGESSRFINAAVIGGLSYIAGYKVINGQLTLGQLTVLSIYLFQLISSIKEAGNIYNDINMKFIVMDRVAQTMDAEVEVKEPLAPLEINNLKVEIKIDSVTFGFLPDQPVIQGVSLKARLGEVIAIVGPSGAGKTTLSHLLIRLYDPWHGSIMLDGCDIKDLRISDLRRIVGFVSHDLLLLKESIKDNIRFGDKKASDDDIIRAAKLSEAHEFISAMADGYDTQAGEGGLFLSQGQRQRIALARALLMRPKILILDEATAFLNSDCEHKILQNLRSIGDEMVIFVISHRLSAILSSDNIFVFNKGNIVEEGIHQDLIKKGGLYYKMYEEQLFSAKSNRHEPL